MLAKNILSIKNIKIPDFGMLHLLLTCLESNITLLRSVLVGDKKCTKWANTFLRVPKVNKHGSL